MNKEAPVRLCAILAASLGLNVVFLRNRSAKMQMKSSPLVCKLACC